ncbi:hypothetical protein NCU08765 [Neurospora crassa OR74A]|uniref:Uncharacterized protein n=2 Tax=Neurospora crassa TaxID=5141 RepID=Q1K4V2_NEUCR|nr:hypothetical protein NCU08765 [Neurospora crassa OR74A]EAA26878.1 hypothetical protein NCU08765 [Neurospora crassa OR74A]CAD70450.1 hypothetical protein [Neurospora crassa]|eukprot:XP_956114.1 hypothetical protein NCU08765 [Neurospora crassa OR74A]
MEGTHEHSPEPHPELSSEPSPHSPGTLRLSTTWPADTYLWDNERVIMSTKWRELPIELVQKIFNHLIEGFINKCFFNDECEFDTEGNFVAMSPDIGIKNGISFITWNLRRESLFRRQRHLIERHFLDEWLTRVTLYLCLDAEFDTPFLRYFHFPESEDYHALTRLGPDKKVTFFLYKPEENGFVAAGDMTIEEMMDDLLDAWDDYVADRTSSYLIVGVRARTWQQNVIQFHRGLDMYNLRKGSVNLEGLEVSEDGRYIRFSWEDFITGMVNWFLYETEETRL